MTLAPAVFADTHRTDNDLLVLVAEENRRAFAVLYDRINGRVFGLVKKVLIDPAQSEEVTQDVFLEVWQSASRFDPQKGNAVSWVLTMAHRRAIDRVRASQASRTRDLAVGIRDYQDSHDDFVDQAETRAEHVRVIQAMSRLTNIQQQALQLAYFQGLTVSQAASAAKVPANTMKTRLRDSLTALRKLVDGPTPLTAA